MVTSFSGYVTESLMVKIINIFFDELVRYGANGQAAIDEVTEKMKYLDGLLTFNAPGRIDLCSITRGYPKA